MRRNVGALGHVAQVAQITVIDDLLVIHLLDAIDFQGLGFIDKVEQGRKGLSKAHAAPAPVADVEYPFHLLVQGLLVVEIRVLPVERMTGRCLEIAFTSHETFPCCLG